jgi:signal transduction histidine kinase
MLPRYGAALAGMFAIAVACFAASTFYADHRMRDITRSSHDIVDNALPSIEHLAVVRTRLRDVDRAATEATEHPGEARADLAPLFDDVTAEEHAYRRAPAYPGEASLWEAARGEIDQARARAREVVDAAARGEVERARDDLRRRLRPALARADGRVHALVALNAQHAAAAARNMETSRRITIGVAYALDAFSVLVAVALALIARALVRRSMRSTEERADELEIFASRVSHDIRGPLTPALVALEWIERDVPLEGAKRRAVERGTRALHSVESIVDALLAFARSGARPPEGAQTDLREGVEAALSDAGPLAHSKGVELAVEGEPPPVAVACARGVLASILGNLLRNAVKYIEGGRERRVVVRARTAGRGTRVEIEDTGPGLPAGMEKKVFEPYVRARADGGGLGLGLATVKRLVEAHGGRVGVSARPSGGASFWFELPSARDAT